MLLFWEPGGWESPPEAGWRGVCPGVGQWGLQAGDSQGSVGLQDWKLLYTSREQVTLNYPSFYTFQNHPRGQGPNSRTLSKSLVAWRIQGCEPLLNACLLRRRAYSSQPAFFSQLVSTTGFRWVVQLPEGAVLPASRSGWQRPQESSGRNRKI